VTQSTYKLRDATADFKDVVIFHDTTQQERHQCKQLVAEAEDRAANDVSGEYIYRVRGPRGEMRIQKKEKERNEGPKPYPCIKPVSFFLFINDLPDEIISRICFADDTKFTEQLAIPLMSNFYSPI